MRKKLGITIMIAVWIALGVCLYGVTFAETSMNEKIACGVAFAMLYCGMILIPYLVAKRKGCDESIGCYLKSIFLNQ